MAECCDNSILNILPLLYESMWGRNKTITHNNNILFGTEIEWL